MPGKRWGILKNEGINTAELPFMIRVKELIPCFGSESYQAISRNAYPCIQHFKFLLIETISPNSLRPLNLTKSGDRMEIATPKRFFESKLPFWLRVESVLRRFRCKLIARHVIFRQCLFPSFGRMRWKNDMNPISQSVLSLNWRWLLEGLIYISGLCDRNFRAV
jgi:hypothetical protein